MPNPEIKFFNSLSSKLEIELTEPAERIGKLLNVKATPDARIKSLKLTAEVFNRDTKTFRGLTAEESDSVAFRGSQITLRSESGRCVMHMAPNGNHFTVQDLLSAVAETERQTRNETAWLGGVDVQHIFFEGIHESEGGVWEIVWGS